MSDECITHPTDDASPAVERRLATIEGKLDRLDEAIRGNGRPGILIRLDRLEQDARRQGRLIWMVVGACLTAGGSALVAYLSGGGAA